ncbi:MAG: helix-turn-helix domain-containing protein [Phenylobacterium sp.]|nr:helix-turn-helix domain-containing protein [Phenylobacterium sp.]
MAEEGERDAGTAAPAPDLQDGEHVGDALRAIRVARGLSVADIASLTRIRPAYLEAIEALHLQDLPSRPFTIGYIRAYAQALGLPGDVAIARFKADDPDRNDALRPPVGVRRMADPRLRLMMLAGLMILSAILVWNLVRRGTLNEEGRRPASIVATAPVEAAPTGAMVLGAPLPAPVESNAPPPYLTPGLEAELSAALPEGLIATEDPTLLDLGETLAPRGRVHGAAGRVVLQARRPTTLIVWGPDRSAWFARQLAAGEAYRTDPVPGLSFETVEAGVIAVYLDGRARGVLPAGITRGSALTRPPPA